MTEEMRYTNSAETPGGTHELQLIENGQELGRASLFYYNRPIPHYYLIDLKVPQEHRGKGYGSKLMDLIERTLKAKGKAGLLIDDTANEFDENHPSVIGMYARRGWELVPGTTATYVYNFPKSADIRVMASATERTMKFVQPDDL